MHGTSIRAQDKHIELNFSHQLISFFLPKFSTHVQVSLPSREPISSLLYQLPPNQEMRVGKKEEKNRGIPLIGCSIRPRTPMHHRLRMVTG
jgi:hypothetical protein